MCQIKPTICQSESNHKAELAVHMTSSIQVHTNQNIRIVFTDTIAKNQLKLEMLFLSHMSNEHNALMVDSKPMTKKKKTT
jgi:hypothetical protein